jgi:hypothetical protein
MIERLRAYWCFHHNWQRLIAPDLELFPQLPVPLEIVAVEHPQGHHRLVQRRRTQPLLVAQIDQVIEQHPFADLLERSLWMTGIELAHLAEILRLAAPSQRFGIDEDYVVLIGF